jgi:hydroxypyruvate reductase
VTRDRITYADPPARFEAGTPPILEAAGLAVARAWHGREGEARDQATAWVHVVVSSSADAIIGGGELTVTVTGDGTGGRNTELALAAAIELDRTGLDATIASLASDGQDGGVDAAGAIVQRDTVARLRNAGIDAAEALADNDSGTALGTIEALVTPGPTGTNVNDVYIGIRGTAAIPESE